MDNLRESKNVAVVEGLLQELDLTEANDKNGRPYIRGRVTIRTEQKVGQEVEISEIPVSVFAYKSKNDGNANPAYANIKTLETFKRLTTDGDNAERIRLTSGRIGENLYAPNGKLISSWVLNNSFFNKVTGDYAPKAVFEMQIVVRSIIEETDVNEVPTGRLKVSGVTVKYNGDIDQLNFVVENPQAIAHIQRNWNEKDTVNIKGYIRVKPVAKVSVKKDNDDFGDDIDTDVGTRTVRELVIAGGSTGCLDSDEAYDFEAIRQAVVARKARVDQVEADGLAKSKSNSGSKTSAKKGW